MNPGAIPQSLSERDQWVIWRLVAGRKRPYVASDARRPASTTDRSTWSAYEVARKTAELWDVGLGYVFSEDDEFAGLDLDGVVIGGQLHSAAAAIAVHFDGYEEISPSGVGLHILVKGRLLGPGRSTISTPWGGELAIYDRSRFFAMTGRSRNGRRFIPPRQPELDTFLAE